MFDASDSSLTPKCFRIDISVVDFGRGVGLD